MAHLLRPFWHPPAERQQPFAYLKMPLSEMLPRLQGLPVEGWKSWWWCLQHLECSKEKRTKLTVWCSAFSHKLSNVPVGPKRLGTTGLKLCYQQKEKMAIVPRKLFARFWGINLNHSGIIHQFNYHKGHLLLDRRGSFLGGEPHDSERQAEEMVDSSLDVV